MRLAVKKGGVVGILVSLVFICGLLIILGILTPEKQNGFWGQLGIARENIEEVQLEFQNQRVSLNDAKTTAFLDTLTTLEETEVADDHEFTPSDIKVILKANGEEQEVIFYWFANHQTLPAGVIVEYTSSDIKVPKLVGDRVDVVMNGSKYHFRFTTEQVWTETLMRQTYDQLAESKGLLTRKELLGGDVLNEPISGFQEEAPKLEEVLNSSELIFLGTHMAKAKNDSYGQYRHIESLEVFKIDEVLKGNTEEAYYRVPSEHTVNRAAFEEIEGQLWNRVSIAVQSIQNPDYQTGVRYLICVDADQDGIFQMRGQYDTAVVDGDTLFPRYNTEQHPFYNVTIQTVKDRLAEN